MRKRSAPMAGISAWSRSFSPFSTTHEAGENATCPQKGAEANCSAGPDRRDACESAVDRPSLVRSVVRLRSPKHGQAVRSPKDREERLGYSYMPGRSGRRRTRDRQQVMPRLLPTARRDRGFRVHHPACSCSPQHTFILPPGEVYVSTFLCQVWIRGGCSAFSVPIPARLMHGECLSRSFPTPGVHSSHVGVFCWLRILAPLARQPSVRMRTGSAFLHERPGYARSHLPVSGKSRSCCPARCRNQWAAACPVAVFDRRGEREQRR